MLSGLALPLFSGLGAARKQASERGHAEAVAGAPPQCDLPRGLGPEKTHVLWTQPDPHLCSALPLTE